MGVTVSRKTIFVRGLLLVPVILSLSGCFLLNGDGATRIAYRLESEVKQLGSADGQSHTFSYIPKGGYDDCSEAYDVQFSERSALVVWCKDASGTTTSSHTTTYHLNFVRVPKTWNVEKKPGEAMRITLTRQGSDAVITDVL